MHDRDQCTSLSPPSWTFQGGKERMRILHKHADASKGHRASRGADIFFRMVSAAGSRRCMQNLSHVTAYPENALRDCVCSCMRAPYVRMRAYARACGLINPCVYLPTAHNSR